MKHLVFLFFSFVFFISCQKDPETNDQSVKAESLLNVSYGNDPAQKMDLYLPSGRSDTTKLIILFHGGGWKEGDKSDFTSFVSRIQQRLPGCAIANINYRLATTSTNHFPTQENDVKAATDFLLQNSSNYKISQKFVLMGASAGAHLSLLHAYKLATPHIKAVIDFFGPTDMVELYNYAAVVPSWQLELQNIMDGSPANNAAMYQQSSPIHFVTAQSPPTIILHGDMDILVKPSHSIALKNKLQSFGVDHQLITYPGQGHALWPDPILDDAFNKIEAFLKTHVQ